MAYWDFDTDTVQQDGENIPLVADYHLPSQLSTPYGIVYYTVPPNSEIISYTFEDVHGIELLCPSNSTLYRTDTITLPNGDVVKLESFRWLEFGYKHKNLPDNLLRGMENLGSGFESRTMYLPEECEHIGSDFLSTRGLSGTYNPSFKSQIVLPQSLKSTASTPAIGDNFLRFQKNFNKSLHIPAISGAGLQIGNYFMYGCSAFNSPLTMDSSITSFGTHFLSVATVFNQPIAWTQQITSVGASFLENTSNFNQTVVFANGAVLGNNVLNNCRGLNSSVDISGVSSIGVGFMQYLRAFDSSSGNTPPVVIVGNNPATIAYQSNNTFSAYSNLQPAYTGGVKFYGDTAADWVARFPTRTSTPYRNTGIYRPYYARVWYLDANNAEQHVDLTTQADYNKLGNSSTSTTYQFNFTNAGVTTTRNKVTGVEIGDTATSTPNYFLSYCTALTRDIVIPKNVTNIYESFMANAITTGKVLFEEGSSSLSISSYFLSNATINQDTVTFPNRTSSVIAQSALSGIEASNNNNARTFLTVNVPGNVTTIQGSFLYNALDSSTYSDSGTTKAMGIKVNLAEGVQSIGDSFLSGVGQRFKQSPIEVSFPSTLTSIGNNFLYSNCVCGFGHTASSPVGAEIDLSGTAITSIGNNWLVARSSIYDVQDPPYFGDFSMPNSVTSVGTDFMRGVLMYGDLNLSSNLTTYGNNFLYSVAFYQPSDVVVHGLSLPNASGNITIGNSFMMNVRGPVGLGIPANTYSIGDYFCANAHLRPFSLPTFVQSWGVGFLRDCNLVNDASISNPFTVTPDTSGESVAHPAIDNHTAESSGYTQFTLSFGIFGSSAPTIEGTTLAVNGGTLTPFQKTTLKAKLNSKFPALTTADTGQNLARRPWDVV